MGEQLKDFKNKHLIVSVEGVNELVNLSSILISRYSFLYSSIRLLIYPSNKNMPNIHSTPCLGPVLGAGDRVLGKTGSCPQFREADNRPGSKHIGTHRQGEVH